MKFRIKKDTPMERQNRHWQFCVGSGHAALALRSDYAKQLKFIHDELGIQHVRFHGIFSDDMHVVTDLSQILPYPGGERFREISFRDIGLAYDNVLVAGMKPSVELSFMPGLLASGDTQCMFFHKGNITPPKNEDEWTSLIVQFVEYLFHRYGKEEVETWPFEVWNEPDLFIFFDGTRDDYFHLYEITARAVKSVDPKIQIGGPATSGSRWIKPFVQYCKEHNVPLDFVSTHQYAGDPIGLVNEEDAATQSEEAQREAIGELNRRGDYYAALPDSASVLDALRWATPDKSETEDIAYGILNTHSKAVKEQAQGLPVVYTEWSENSIFGAATNDTRKVAAYAVRAILETQESIDYSGIWCFSDIFDEFHNFPQEFHGGFGMQTNNGIPKPVFYALKMMAQTADQRYILPGATDGEIGMAAFADEEETQVILFRQKMKNLDLPKETAEVEIELQKEVQQIIMRRVDEAHGNPLALWEQMGSPQDLTPCEVEDIKARSAVIDESLPYTIEDDVLRFQVELGVNDIYFVRIRT